MVCYWNKIFKYVELTASGNKDDMGIHTSPIKLILPNNVRIYHIAGKFGK